AVVGRALQTVLVPVFIGVEFGADPYMPPLATAIEVHVPRLDANDQVEHWRATLKTEGLPIPDDAALRALVQRYPTNADAIESTVRELKLRAALLPKTIALDSLLSAASRQSSHAMGSIAQRIPTSLGWADVVLPIETLEQLMEIITFARYRSQVMDDWG